LDSYLEEEKERRKTAETLEKRREFVQEHPVSALFFETALYLLITTEPKKPAWLKNIPPIHPRLAGPWRGKGSFGGNFGSQESGHK